MVSDEVTREQQERRVLRHVVRRGLGGGVDEWRIQRSGRKVPGWGFAFREHGGSVPENMCFLRCYTVGQRSSRTGSVSYKGQSYEFVGLCPYRRRAHESVAGVVAYRPVLVAGRSRSRV